MHLSRAGSYLADFFRALSTYSHRYDTKTTFIPSNRTDPRGAEGPCRLDAKSIRAACLGSLRRLQTDYVDLYQVGP